MTLHLILETAAAGCAAYMMMRAGLAKHALERRRDRRPCPACGRVGGCDCLH